MPGRCVAPLGTMEARFQRAGGARAAQHPPPCPDSRRRGGKLSDRSLKKSLLSDRLIGQSGQVARNRPLDGAERSPPTT